jgi:hypothetical protein
MNEFLRKRIERKLDALPDERIYQVLDYIEFLESKYAERTSNQPSAFQKLAETVEDTLRAGRMGASAIKGTMDAMSAARNVMSGLAAAGKSVVDQVAARDARRINSQPSSSLTTPAPAETPNPPSHAGSESPPPVAPPPA